MKFLKKAVSALLAAVTAVTMLFAGSVTASAASAKMKLRTVSVEKIEGASGVGSIGDGYYCLVHSGSKYIDQIIYIGEDELKSWQKTGKIAYKTVQTDFKLTDTLKVGKFSADSSYVQFQYYDANGNISKRYIATHNEKNTKITTAYTKGSDWCYTNPNGYTVESKWDNSKKNFTITVTAPDGKKKSSKLTYKGGEDAWGSVWASSGTGKYVAYAVWLTDAKDIEIMYYDYEVYGVKKNGKLDKLYSGKNVVGLGGFNGTPNNAFCWFDVYAYSQAKVYLADSGKKYDFLDIVKSNGASFGDHYFSGINGKVYGSRAIATLSTGEGGKSTYALADLSTAKETGEYIWFNSYITAISNEYQSMSTEDGKIYLVQNDKGKWGYINKKGKELAWFDSAGSFIGDYAPVVKNGKAYLIDRNMKQVSEKIDADAVLTLDDGMYLVGKGDKEMLMTYKK